MESVENTISRRERMGRGMPGWNGVDEVWYEGDRRQRSSVAWIGLRNPFVHKQVPQRSAVEGEFSTAMIFDWPIEAQSRISESCCLACTRSSIMSLERASR